MARKSSRVAEVTKAQAPMLGMAPPPDDAGLAAVSKLAQMQMERERDVAAAEDALRDAKDALRQIAEVDLPEAMREVGIKTFTTIDGLVVTVKPEVQVSISVANRPAAYQWLIDNGFGGLLKLDVELHFDRGDREKAEKLAEQLRKKKLDVNVNQSIHAQTLKAFAKERIADTESNIEFPLELFGARPYTVATVKPKK